jgi:argininosuccinate lyase
MKKLWQKNWTLDRTVEAFETRDDLVMDGYLVKADVIGSLAHAKMLAKIGILTADEFESIHEGLTKIIVLWEKGRYTLREGDEDIHTKIENTLTQWYGDVGKKIHTGRSRNDQVVTAIRLYTKEQLLSVWEAAIDTAFSFAAFAASYEFVPMPGYTHMQKAMPSSVGMWAGAFAEGLSDSLLLLQTAYTLNDQSPLGSAAAYGVPLPLDRAYAASLMGFAGVQNNSLYCQNARGYIEAAVVSSCVAVLQNLSKFASDVLLFTTSEFDYFSVADELCSGSSIMPQKRNIDIAELIRSKVHIVLGHYTALVGLSGNLVSGYNRDLQDSKKPLFESLSITLGALRAAGKLMSGITPKVTTLRAACTAEIFAAHRAFALVGEGIAFRDAYHAEGPPGKYQSALDSDALSDILASSTHEGGTGNLGLAGISAALEKEHASWKTADREYSTAVNRLLESV